MNRCGTSMYFNFVVIHHPISETPHRSPRRIAPRNWGHFCSTIWALLAGFVPWSIWQIWNICYLVSYSLASSTHMGKEYLSWRILSKFYFICAINLQNPHRTLEAFSNSWHRPLHASDHSIWRSLDLGRQDTFFWISSESWYFLHTAIADRTVRRGTLCPGHWDCISFTVSSTFFNLCISSALLSSDSSSLALIFDCVWHMFDMSVSRLYTLRKLLIANRLNISLRSSQSFSPSFHACQLAMFAVSVSVLWCLLIKLPHHIDRFSWNYPKLSTVESRFKRKFRRQDCFP